MGSRYTPGGHWLGDRVAVARRLGMTFRAGAEGPDRNKKREAFLGELQILVREVASRDEVTACFGFHEGLLLASAGEWSSFEGLAAMSQLVLESARTSTGRVRLGAIEQVVIVGAEHKLALICVEEMTLGIVSRKEVDITQATAR